MGASGLAAMLVGLFPANVYAAVTGVTLGESARVSPAKTVAIVPILELLEAVVLSASLDNSRVR